MFDKVLLRMRELVRTTSYIMTVHGHEEMEADQLTLFDVEQCILNGEIVDRQVDRRTTEPKYLVQGRTLQGRHAIVVAKIGPTGKLVIITTYAFSE